jgi:serine phosphatase RsbU (regulator of sigma subunit)
VWNSNSSSASVLPDSVFQGKSVELSDLPGWRYKQGNNPDCATKSYPHHELPQLSLHLPTDSLYLYGWEKNQVNPDRNNGWFRLHLFVPPLLRGHALALNIKQNGITKIYANGLFVKQLGELNKSGSIASYGSLAPVIIPLGEADTCVLAIHYTVIATPAESNYSGYGGLWLNAQLAQKGLDQYIDQTQEILTRYNLIAGILLALTLVHGLIFMFRNQQRIHLFYALFVLVACCIHFRWTYLITHREAEAGFMWWVRITNMLWSGVFLCLFAFIRHLFHGRLFVRSPWNMLLWCVGIASVLTNFGLWMHALQLWALMGFLLCVEILISIYGAWKKREFAQCGIGMAALLFVIYALFWFVLNAMHAQGSIWVSAFEASYYLGTTALPLAISVFLATDMARTNRALEHQLREVRQLTEKTLFQERRVREQETARLLLESDNDRKTKELEEARTLQQALLPQALHSTEDLEIEARMITAHEVGGDYYDVAILPDGALLAAIGDATGHGMKAGIIVAAVKSLFATMASDNGEPAAMLEKANKLLRKMNFRTVFMAFALVKIKENIFTYSSAGMPALIHWSASESKVKEISRKALPLGCTAQAVYQQGEYELQPNDLLILISDGFHERFSAGGEMLGYDIVPGLVEEYCNNSLQMNNAYPMPAGLIDYLLDTGNAWAGHNGLPDDDITMMVIRKKPGYQ